MTEEEGTVWEPKTATEAFIDSLVNGTPSREESLPSSEEENWVYRGGRIYDGMPAKESNPYSAIGKPRYQKYYDGNLIVEMPLQPWKGPLRARMDRQAKDVRRYLNNPDSVVLVIRGRNYAATSVFRVIWLYIMTALFGLPKPRKEKKQKKSKNGKKQP